MSRVDVAEFADEFRTHLDEYGIGAVEHFDWPGRFWALGFEMDCGMLFERVYGIRIGDADALESRIGGACDLQALGNGAFSMCRRMTHSDFYSGYEDDLRWLVMVLRRIVELTN